LGQAQAKRGAHKVGRGGGGGGHKPGGKQLRGGGLKPSRGPRASFAPEFLRGMDPGSRQEGSHEGGRERTLWGARGGENPGGIRENSPGQEPLFGSSPDALPGGRSRRGIKASPPNWARALVKVGGDKALDADEARAEFFHPRLFRGTKLPRRGKAQGVGWSRNSDGKKKPLSPLFGTGEGGLFFAVLFLWVAGGILILFAFLIACGGIVNFSRGKPRPRPTIFPELEVFHSDFLSPIWEQAGAQGALGIIWTGYTAIATLLPVHEPGKEWAKIVPFLHTARGVRGGTFATGPIEFPARPGPLCCWAWFMGARGQSARAGSNRLVRETDGCGGYPPSCARSWPPAFACLLLPLGSVRAPGEPPQVSGLLGGDGSISGRRGSYHLGGRGAWLGQDGRRGCGLVHSRLDGFLGARRTRRGLWRSREGRISNASKIPQKKGLGRRGGDRGGGGPGDRPGETFFFPPHVTPARLRRGRRHPSGRTPICFGQPTRRHRAKFRRATPSVGGGAKKHSPGANPRTICPPRSC